MRPKEFQKYIDRDVSCYATGIINDRLVPNHRINRGAGGSPARDIPSNIILFDSIKNGLIEADPDWQHRAKQYGWKLSSWMIPHLCPVYHVTRGWLMLDDAYGAYPASQTMVDDWKKLVEWTPR